MTATLIHLTVAEEATHTSHLVARMTTTQPLQLPAEAQMIGAAVQALTTLGLQVLDLLGRHPIQVVLVLAGVLQVPILAHHGVRVHQVAMIQDLQVVLAVLMTQVAQAHTTREVAGN